MPIFPSYLQSIAQNNVLATRGTFSYSFAESTAVSAGPFSFAQSTALAFAGNRFGIATSFAQSTSFNFGGTSYVQSIAQASTLSAGPAFRGGYLASLAQASAIGAGPFGSSFAFAQSSSFGGYRPLFPRPY